MKTSERLGELVLRLKLNQDFVEFWKLVLEHRDGLVIDAIHNTKGDPAEKRGAAREFDRFVARVDGAPEKVKQLNETRS